MFFDRYDAGAQLANKLLPYKDTDAVIYALPRGGVITGYRVAQVLQAPLDVVVTRKIGHPMNSECAICAITEDGDRICDEVAVQGVGHDWLVSESRIQQQEAHRRRRVYCSDQPSISASGRVAILVDDGIATGLTMKAAIRTIQKQNPSKIVVASPVAPHDAVLDLRQLADEVVVVCDGDNFKESVGAYYKHFPEVFDKEVQSVLRSVQAMSRTYDPAHSLAA